MPPATGPRGQRGGPQPRGPRRTGRRSRWSAPARQQLLLRHVPAGIVVVDRQYRMVSVSSAAGGSWACVNRPAPGLPAGARGLPTRRARRDRLRVPRPRDGDVEKRSRWREWAAAHLFVRCRPGPGLDLDWVAVTALDATSTSPPCNGCRCWDDQRQLSEELGLASRRLTETNKELQDTTKRCRQPTRLMLAQELQRDASSRPQRGLQATSESWRRTRSWATTRAGDRNEAAGAHVGLQELNRVVTGERAALEMVRAPFTSWCCEAGAEGRGGQRVVTAVFGGSGRWAGPSRSLPQPGVQMLSRCAGLPPRPPWTSGRLRRRSERPAAGAVRSWCARPVHDADAGSGVIIYAEDVTGAGTRSGPRCCG
jgi:hypothetical protein